MSTKIYSGYRLHENPFNVIHEIRSTLTAAQQETAKTMLATHWVTQWDKFNNNLPIQGVDIKARRYGPAWWLNYGDFQPNLLHRWHWHNVMPSITFHERNNEYAALFFDSYGNLETEWQTLSFVEHFPYWNNTDAPDNVTEEEWENRKEWWSTMLQFEAFLPPSQIGFMFQLETPDWLTLTFDDTHVPSNEQRLKTLEMSSVHNEPKVVSPISAENLHQWVKNF